MGQSLLVDSFEMELFAVSMDVGANWKADELLGHGDEESMQQMAKQLGWIIT